VQYIDMAKYNNIVPALLSVSVVNMSDSVGHVRFFDMIFEVRQFLQLPGMSDIRAHAH